LPCLPRASFGEGLAGAWYSVSAWWLFVWPPRAGDYMSGRAHHSSCCFSDLSASYQLETLTNWILKRIWHTWLKLINLRFPALQIHQMRDFLKYQIWLSSVWVKVIERKILQIVPSSTIQYNTYYTLYSVKSSSTYPGRLAALERWF
jgi:hypothetical protein